MICSCLFVQRKCPTFEPWLTRSIRRLAVKVVLAENEMNGEKERRLPGFLIVFMTSPKKRKIFP